ncbi:hypothetical protein Tco_0881386 [Tanacetum coccineum]
MTEEGGDSNDIRSTYDEIDEEDEVFRSDYTDIDTAMERQRHRQEILDDSTMQKIPRFKTKLPIERYAQKKYTKTMFTLIQEEINLAVREWN